MSCPAPETLFLPDHPDHVQGRLHARTCERCQALLSSDRDLEQLLRRLPRPMPAGDFVGDVMKRVDALPQRYVFRTFAAIWGGAYVLWCLVAGLPGLAAGFGHALTELRKAGAATGLLLEASLHGHRAPILMPAVVSLGLVLLAFVTAHRLISLRIPK